MNPENSNNHIFVVFVISVSALVGLALADQNISIFSEPEEIIIYDPLYWSTSFDNKSTIVDDVEENKK